MEPIDNEGLLSKNSVLTKKIDRISLSPIEASKIDKLSIQANQASKGYVILSKSDVVNFIIRQFPEEFQNKHLRQIRAENYEPIRHLTWLASKLREALSIGDTQAVSALQKEVREIQLTNQKVTKNLPGEIEGPTNARRTSNRRRRNQNHKGVSSVSQSADNEVPQPLHFQRGNDETS